MLQFFLPQGWTFSLPFEYAHYRFSQVYFGSFPLCFLPRLSSACFISLAFMFKVFFECPGTLGCFCSCGRKIDAQLYVYLSRACQSVGARCFVRGPPDKGLSDFSLGQVSFPRGQSSQLLGELGTAGTFCGQTLWPGTSLPLSLCQSPNRQRQGAHLVVWDRRRLGDSPSVFMVSECFTPQPQRCL